MSSTPNTDQFQRVNAFISSLKENDLFLSHVDENVNFLVEVNAAEFHLRLAKLSELQDIILDAGMEQHDYFGLMVEIRAYQFCIRLETLKVTFASMLDRGKLATRDELSIADFQLSDLTLGTLIRRINNELYPLNNGLKDSERSRLTQQRDDNQELFFRTFRNDIIHRDFEVVGTNLIYGSDSDPQTWNSQTAQTMSDQLTTLEVIINSKLTKLRT